MVRYGRQNLNAELGFFAKLVRTLIEHMGDTFPELREREEFVTGVIREEEESFSKTVDNGIVMFKKQCDAPGPNNKVFSGKDAHFLYTSMGFPINLTELMCADRELTLDMAEYDAEMEKEQDKSRREHEKNKSAGSGKDMRLVAEQTSPLVNRDVSAVRDRDLGGCTG